MIDTDKIKFIDYNIEQEEQKLVKYAEDLLGKSLYPAQYERLMISIIEYKASLLAQRFNEAAKLNLAQCSEGLILEAIAEMAGVTKLAGAKGEDLLKIELNTTFTSDLTISKGLEILSKDEKYTFLTTEDCIISASETVGYVTIRAEEIGEAVNAYGAGDVNILVKPISYIKSVTNVNGVSGGADEESRESLIKRVLLAPESYSCAGAKNSYIFHTLSANAGIIDAQAESPQQPATVDITTTTEITEGEGEDSTTTTQSNTENYTVDDSGNIDNDTFNLHVDYKTGKLDFTLKSDTSKVYSFTIPPQAQVLIYPLTKEDVTPQSVLNDVDAKLNGEKINPMTDFVKVIAPTKKTKAINLDVVLDISADYDSCVDTVNNTLEQYKQEIRKKLGANIEPSQIIARVGNIDGVYSVKPDLTETITSALNEFYELSFNTTITQREV